MGLKLVNSINWGLNFPTFYYSGLLFRNVSPQVFYCETSLFHWFSWVIISCLIYYYIVHDIDICLFEQELFIIDLINNLSLKLVNPINQGLNFPTHMCPLWISNAYLKTWRCRSCSTTFWLDPNFPIQTKCVLNAMLGFFNVQFFSCWFFFFFSFFGSNISVWLVVIVYESIRGSQLVKFVFVECVDSLSTLGILFFFLVSIMNLCSLLL